MSAWMEAAMTHYIAILIPSAAGEWRVVFPDLPGCEAKGFSFDDAKVAAMTALLRWMKNAGPTARNPRDLSEIEHDTEWLARNDVDLLKAVITLVPLAA
jgi:predicted RNase H-like HicB family nuclease